MVQVIQECMPELLENPGSAKRWTYALGGSFSSHMEAKDGSMGFDFTGTFTEIVDRKSIVYSLDDERVVTVEFIPESNGVVVRETFEAESANDGEQQRQGWQAILHRFARYVEAKS